MNQVLPFWMLNDLLTEEGLTSQLEQSLRDVLTEGEWGSRKNEVSEVIKSDTFNLN